MHKDLKAHWCENRLCYCKRKISVMLLKPLNMVWLQQKQQRSLSLIFYLKVWSFLHLLGFFLGRSLHLVLLLVPFQSTQLLLNAPTLLPHLLPVLLVKQGELPTATRKGGRRYIITET